MDRPIPIQAAPHGTFFSGTTNPCVGHKGGVLRWCTSFCWNGHETGADCVLSLIPLGCLCELLVCFEDASMLVLIAEGLHLLATVRLHAQPTKREIAPSSSGEEDTQMCRFVSVARSARPMQRLAPVLWLLWCCSHTCWPR